MHFYGTLFSPHSGKRAFTKSDFYFLLSKFSQHDIIDVMDQCEVLWNREVI